LKDLIKYQGIEMHAPTKAQLHALSVLSLHTVEGLLNLREQNHQYLTQKLLNVRIRQDAVDRKKSLTVAAI
jgi:hypothetical protein